MRINSLVECVPNFSEGRDQSVIRRLAEAATASPGAALLHQTADVSHNRSVFTLAGEPEGVMEAVFRMAETAVALIDLNAHRGAHPRMGAVDVIPFVPLKDIDMAACVSLSEKLGRRLWEELGLPVFLYGESARSPERRDLAFLRRGQFEGLAERITREGLLPDFGDNSPHPTAGVTACGARGFLVAFNMNLDTSDIGVARAVAKIIRASSGGLPHVKAIGVLLEDRNIAQVSVNMTDYKRTPLYRVLEFVRFEAARYGARVVGTEIVGMAPAAALLDCARYYMCIEDFDIDARILEKYM